MQLKIPLEKKIIKKLKVGDTVFLSGKVVTGRDAVHQFLATGGKSPVSLTDGVIYHCGPMTIEKKTGWEVIAAGPTTSMREEPYMAKMIKEHGIKAIIGKGGMGEDTRKACKKYKCVYLHAIGGAGAFYAKCIKKVKGVYLKKFGLPEAMWEFEIENFPAVVMIDTKGKNWNKELIERSGKVFDGFWN